MIKKRYIVIVFVFVIIIVIIGTLVNDFKNDRDYLISQGFDKRLMKVYVDDYYCNDPLEAKEGEKNCIIYRFGSFIKPSFNMGINVSNGDYIEIRKMVRGLSKKEHTEIIFVPNEDTNSSNAFCEVDKDFTVLENENNSPFCYSDEYSKALDDNREYIEGALDEFYSYYDGFSLARSWS